MDISKLKAISAGTLNAIVQSDNKKVGGDERFWKPTRDENGNGGALIRFLPSIVAGELPWVEQYSYFIKDNSGRPVYVETSRRTIQQSDPMQEFISNAWREASTDMMKDSLRRRGLSKPRHSYIANILVINDPAHPENNGKVFLYNFGQKIYNMILDKAKAPMFPGDVGNINVTDWINGCNFRVVVCMSDRFVNYDRSSFDNCSPIGDDATIAAIAEKMYDLSEFVGEGAVKSYEALSAKVSQAFPNGAFGTGASAFGSANNFAGRQPNQRSAYNANNGSTVNFASGGGVPNFGGNQPVQPQPVQPVIQPQPVQPAIQPTNVGGGVNIGGGNPPSLKNNNNSSNDPDAPWLTDDDAFDFDKLMADVNV